MGRRDQPGAASSFQDIFQQVVEGLALHQLAVSATGARSPLVALRSSWDGVPTVLTSREIWATITPRTILFGHFAVSFLRMLIFGPMNLMCFFLFGLVFPV
ncbi:uncharacterized protein LMH87_007607 [Akanthomyces muscarius]|uniref:Uncharacterized protein n=1 Tax=Akanthomyces muscarius TaxID=2231603 RepID=A0A9W8UR90_AKAMU|nr:uncharacterized protein LMH87_007607 [Akanthomyces muscarius]KAJ4161576.1 hypothetical protein LMH87_007607 [Akanthomyces muscarius]